jgi:tetratricopeptide (TPR) repeat protein
MGGENNALATAEALLDIGRPVQAREHAAGFLAGHPDDARGLRLIARCYEATDDYPQMLDAAQAAVTADVDSYQGHVLLASALIHLHRYAEAVDVAGRAIRLYPHGWRGHLLAGVAQCARGRRRAGMAAVNRAVALAPDEPHTHYVQALLRHSAGNRLGAKHAYRRALRLDPGHAGALRGLGHLALAAGRLVAAVGHFTGAAAAEPDTGTAGPGLERALLGVAGLGLGTGWLLLFVLVFSMFPAAWVVAAVATTGFALVAARFWRRVPAGGRLLLRARLASPRVYVRLCAIGLSVLVALGVGIADAGIDPDSTDVDLWPAVGAVGVTFLGTVLAVLAADVVDRREPAGESGPEPPDAPLQHATARLTWRALQAGLLPAGVLWVLSVGGTPWSVRAATGTALIAGYAAVLVRIRRSVLYEPHRSSPVLARLLGPISLAAGIVLVYLPLAAYWPGALPEPAEVTVLLVLGLLVLGYATRLPVSGARWLWRRVSARRL